MSKILISVCAFLMLVIAPSVQADPVGFFTVTSGSISVTGIAGGPVYSLVGQNFSATGAGEPGFAAPQLCFPCVGGSPIGLAATFSGASLGTGNVTINGMTFNSITISGVMEISGNPLFIPSAPTNISFSGQFSFGGSLIGCQVPHVSCVPATAVFSTFLTGQGIATVNLTFLQLNASGNPLYVFQNVTYTFQSAEIPEPMTITLLTTGLLALGARLKLRGRLCRRLP